MCLLGGRFRVLPFGSEHVVHCGDEFFEAVFVDASGGGGYGVGAVPDEDGAQCTVVVAAQVGACTVQALLHGVGEDFAAWVDDALSFTFVTDEKGYMCHASHATLLSMTAPQTPKLAGNSKMQDVAEFRRWYAEGREYRWMVDQYKEKYGLSVTPAMFSNWRARLGLKPRVAVRDETLIPWDVRLEHSWLSPMRMLRAEIRRRGGLELTPEQAARLDVWKGLLEGQDLVVHYSRDTEQGFFYVPRRDGVDDDIIRNPAVE